MPTEGVDHYIHQLKQYVHTCTSSHIVHCVQTTPENSDNAQKHEIKKEKISDNPQHMATLHTIILTVNIGIVLASIPLLLRCGCVKCSHVV